MARKEHTHHYIYRTTCNVTGRYYIGMHSTSNLKDGYIGSGRRLWLSINKHGKENHSIEILEWLPDRSSLKLREKEIVNEDLLRDEMCMNLQLGGGGGFSSEDHRLKFIHSDGPENFAKRLKKDIDFFNKHSVISSNRMKKTHADGKIKYDTFKGMKHSEEAKKKMSESSIGKGLGKDNSQFGTCWITNSIENKKIKKSDDIPDGWSYGRKIKK